MLIEMAIKGQVDKLVQLAQRGANPIVYAQVVLDGVPQAYLPQFAEFIMAPNAIDKLESMNPGVNSTRDWFVMLRDEIVAILTGEEEETNMEGNQVAGIVEIDPHDSTTNGHPIG